MGLWFVQLNIQGQGFHSVFLPRYLGTSLAFTLTLREYPCHVQEGGVGGGEVSTVYLSTNFAHISTSLYLSIIDVQIVQQCCLLCFSRSTDKHIKAVNQIFKILLTNRSQQ